MSLIFALLLVAGNLLPCFPADKTIMYATWDKLMIKPQLPMPVVKEKGDVRLLLIHHYPVPLTHFEITGRSRIFSISVEPRQIETFQPTEIRTIQMTLRRTRQSQPSMTRPDRENVVLSFRADEISSSKSVVIAVPLSEKGEKAIERELSIPVGEMEVRIGRFGGEIYCMYAALALLLAALCWRKWRIR